MGKTVVVADGVSLVDGIGVYERMAWIVEHDESGEWSVEVMQPGMDVSERTRSLAVACERAIHAIGAGWPRLDAVLEVESVLEARGRVYVVTRCLGTTPTFVVSETSKLGGCAVDRWLDMPRVVDALGSPRLDLFGFCLRDPSHRPRFHVGGTVHLTSSGSA
jgi:hypothetical protein